MPEVRWGSYGYDEGGSDLANGLGAAAVTELVSRALVLETSGTAPADMIAKDALSHRYGRSDRRSES